MTAARLAGGNKPAKSYTCNECFISRDVLLSGELKTGVNKKFAKTFRVENMNLSERAPTFVPTVPLRESNIGQLALRLQDGGRRSRTGVEYSLSLCVNKGVHRIDFLWAALAICLRYLLRAR